MEKKHISHITHETKISFTLLNPILCTTNPLTKLVGTKGTWHRKHNAQIALRTKTSLSLTIFQVKYFSPEKTHAKEPKHTEMTY